MVDSEIPLSMDVASEDLINVHKSTELRGQIRAKESATDEPKHTTND